MPGVTAAVLISSIVVFAGGAVLIWLGLRLVRRVAAHGRRRALELRSHLLPPGPRRDAAALRQQLAAELRSTRQVLAAVPNGRIFQADPTRVLAEAAGHAADLDHDLAMIETFPDRAQQHAALETIRPQALKLIETIHSARRTMLRTAASDRERGLTSLSDTVAHEAAALRNYEQTNRDLTI
ncbi:MAG: hypothetical protein ABI808_14205 [Pseudonocardiales bacterium]